MQPDVRRSAPNLNHWYVVARSTDVSSDKVLGVTLWNEDIALFRSANGKIHALEDRCPHRHVKLSHGKVVANTLQCAYHGWRIKSDGTCSDVPYLQGSQKVPDCSIRSFPALDLDGFIWLFPGDPSLAGQITPMGLPEWNHLNYIASMAVIDMEAHFSFLIENLMDMHHGHLHASYQAWSDAMLVAVKESEGRVDAHYQAQAHLSVKSIFSIAQIVLPQLRSPSEQPLHVSYVYPHWTSTLGQDFRICCLFCPTNSTHTKAYLVHFTSLESFRALHRMPIRFRRWMKSLFFNSTRMLLEGLVRQDAQMVEEEQRRYLLHPERRPMEPNRTLIRVQHLIRDQSVRGIQAGS